MVENEITEFIQIKYIFSIKGVLYIAAITVNVFLYSKILHCYQVVVQVNAWVVFMSGEELYYELYDLNIIKGTKCITLRSRLFLAKNK